MSDETIIIELHCHAVSAKAKLLSPSGDECDAEWIPKSQIVVDGADRGDSGDFSITEWIAKKTGWT